MKEFGALTAAVMSILFEQRTGIQLKTEKHIRLENSNYYYSSALEE